MEYQGKIIRPPSEAKSLILQITYGCSHNQCTFCPSYKEKKFGIKSLEEIKEELDGVKEKPNLIFMCDGDPLIIKQDKLKAVFREITERFPGLNRISMYANTKSIQSKDPEQLQELSEMGLKLIYLGLESGNDTVLEHVKKGVSADEMRKAAKKVRKAGIKLSVMALLGLGGRSKSKEHAVDTGLVLSDMNPEYISLLTVMPVPGTKFHEDVESGKIELPDRRGFLKEMKDVLKNIEVDGSRFYSNHASNYLSLKGKLPREKQKMLEKIDDILNNNSFDELRPEFLRGL